jgi:hypothetical protein
VQSICSNKKSFLSFLSILYSLNFNFSPPETKKFVDLLFKTLETQVYDVPATASVTHTTSAVVEPAITAEPAATKIPITKQPGEPLLSDSLNTANPPSTQSLPGHPVSISVPHQHLMMCMFYERT